jgi:hypothetical protein
LWLLMLLRTSCLTFTNLCQPLHNGIMRSHLLLDAH